MRFRRLSLNLIIMKLIKPKIKDCIAYIESCGWEYLYKNYNFYVFKGRDGKTNMAGNNIIHFTLRELRDAKMYGW